LVSETAETVGGMLHVKSPAITTVNIVTDTEDLHIGHSYEARYNGTARIRHTVIAAMSRVDLVSVDLGDDLVGPEVLIGRNTNSSNTNPGSLRFVDNGGTQRVYWADTTGDLRYHTCGPSSGCGISETGGTVVGSQSSPLYNPYTGELSKNLIAPATPDEGLNTILKTKYWHYDYVDGKYNDSQFIGTYSEVSPWMMKDGGRTFSSVNATSYNSLAIQKLNQKIEELTLEIRRLDTEP